MRYEIEFIPKIQDGRGGALVFGDKIPVSVCSTELCFGENDIKGIAEKCFEYGRSGKYQGIKIKKIGARKISTLQNAIVILEAIERETDETGMNMVDGVCRDNLKDSIAVIKTILKDKKLFFSKEECKRYLIQ